MRLKERSVFKNECTKSSNTNKDKGDMYIIFEVFFIPQMLRCAVVVHPSSSMLWPWHFINKTQISSSSTVSGSKVIPMGHIESHLNIYILNMESLTVHQFVP